MERVFDILHVGLGAMVKATGEVLREESTLSNEERQNYRNGLKMYTYLLHWFLQLSSKVVNPNKPVAKGVSKIV